MIERLVLVLAIFLIVWVLLRMRNQVLLSHKDQLAFQLPGFQQGTPTILYFSSEDCHPCQSIQRPVISRLKTELQALLQVVEIDATQWPEMATQWGVMSLPTTFILDSRGFPRKVNHGVVSSAKLRKQLEGIW